MRLFVSGATATLRRHADRERLGALLVPGAGNTPKLALSLGLPWAADNAAFSGFQPAAFCGLMARISGHPGCRFVACPDVVGEATATLEMFRVWAPVIRALELPVALVGQDGLEKLEVPWDEIDALFLGGSTVWKLGDGAASLAREAKRRGLWVHMGRVNTKFRFRYAFRLGCDSIDGSDSRAGRNSVFRSHSVGWRNSTADHSSSVHRRCETYFVVVIRSRCVGGG